VRLLSLLWLNAMLAGKQAALALGAVPELVPLLRSDCVALVCNAVSAITLLGIALDGKRQFFSCGQDAAKLLASLRDSKHADTQANALLAVDTLSELPALRAVFADI
jgi:hypothetical protein